MESHSKELRAEDSCVLEQVHLRDKLIDKTTLDKAMWLLRCRTRAHFRNY